MRQAVLDDDWVAHTARRHCRHLTDDCGFVDVGTGVRGFAATGDASLLGTYEQGTHALSGDLDSLASLTLDNASQRERVRQLRLQVVAKLDVSRLLIAERRRINAVPSTAIFLEGKRRMDPVRARLQAMQFEEAGLLGERLKNARVARQKTKIIILLATVGGLTLLLFAGVITNQEITQLPGCAVNCKPRTPNWNVA